MTISIAGRVTLPASSAAREFSLESAGLGVLMHLDPQVIPRATGTATADFVSSADGEPDGHVGVAAIAPGVVWNELDLNFMRDGGGHFAVELIRFLPVTAGVLRITCSCGNRSVSIATSALAIFVFAGVNLRPLSESERATSSTLTPVGRSLDSRQ